MANERLPNLESCQTGVKTSTQFNIIQRLKNREKEQRRQQQVNNDTVLKCVNVKIRLRKKYATSTL